MHALVEANTIETVVFLISFRIYNICACIV